VEGCFEDGPELKGDLILGYSGEILLFEGLEDGARDGLDWRGEDI